MQRIIQDILSFRSEAFLLCSTRRQYFQDESLFFSCSLNPLSVFPRSLNDVLRAIGLESVSLKSEDGASDSIIIGASGFDFLKAQVKAKGNSKRRIDGDDVGGVRKTEGDDDDNGGEEAEAGGPKHIPSSFGHKAGEPKKRGRPKLVRSMPSGFHTDGGADVGQRLEAILRATELASLLSSGAASDSDLQMDGGSGGGGTGKPLQKPGKRPSVWDGNRPSKNLSGLPPSALAKRRLSPGAGKQLHRGGAGRGRGGKRTVASGRGGGGKRRLGPGDEAALKRHLKQSRTETRGADSNEDEDDEDRTSDGSEDEEEDQLPPFPHPLAIPRPLTKGENTLDDDNAYLRYALPVYR